jgi:hypothetical protein
MASKEDASEDVSTTKDDASREAEKRNPNSSNNSAVPANPNSSNNSAVPANPNSSINSTNTSDPVHTNDNTADRRGDRRSGVVPVNQHNGVVPANQHSGVVSVNRSVSTADRIMVMTTHAIPGWEQWVQMFK